MPSDGVDLFIPLSTQMENYSERDVERAEI